MRIDDWPINKIMQLPDWCFGIKYAVSVEAFAANDSFAYDISEIALPETMVIWQILIVPITFSAFTNYVRIGLAQNLPATEAEFMELQPLINGMGAQGPGPRQIQLNIYSAGQSIMLRQPVHTASRKLALLTYAAVDENCWVRVVIIISSVPKEIPDWLNLGLDKNQL